MDILGFLKVIGFYPALIISLGVFFADWVTGVAAALRSGRRLKSSIMVTGVSKKITNFFYMFIIGLAFDIASQISTVDGPLAEIATVLVLIPAIPELLSLWENFKIIKTGEDSKPKEGDGI